MDTLTEAQHVKLSIVFLNFNRICETRYTTNCLKQLTAHRSDIEVIAIDNGSEDGTCEFLHSQKDWLKLVCLPDNIGIAGYNIGFAKAQGDYIMVLDDDSHPVDENTLDRLIQCLDTRAEVGIVACQIQSMHGKPFTTWHLPPVDMPGPSMAFVGCGFAIRRELFAQIGWYPEEFFLYQNEIEVAIRAIQEGYIIHYDPCCKVIHRQAAAGRTSWRRVYYPTRNTIWVIRHYFPFPDAAYLITSRLIFGFVRAVQAWEMGWYYQAVKEAFKRPIKAEPLPPETRKQLTKFLATE